jgi:hypothetical protein
MNIVVFVHSFRFNGAIIDSRDNADDIFWLLRDKCPINRPF